MILFLTSSPTGPLDNSRPVDGVDYKNNLIGNLRYYWNTPGRCLYITASPDDFEMNDRVRGDMEYLFGKSGFESSVFDLWDYRTENFSFEALREYDVVILGGGHLPTQNAFFRQIGLKETIQQFEGLVIGISAGTMNCADIVYAQPELEGEALDPCYERFVEGLALTSLNVLPHYQMVKDWWLDGMKLYEDITYGDSYGKRFLVLPDGSYVISDNGRESVWGEAYMICDGVMTQICNDNEMIDL